MNFADHEIQGFYARQVQAINGGDYPGYAATFTDDAVFEIAGLAEPLHGASAIAGHSRAMAEARVASGAIQRHSVVLTALHSTAAKSLRARSYTFVVVTGGGATRQTVSVCDDLLRLGGSGWQVVHRRVFRDDLPS